MGRTDARRPQAYAEVGVRWAVRPAPGRTEPTGLPMTLSRTLARQHGTLPVLHRYSAHIHAGTQKRRSR